MDFGLVMEFVKKYGVSFVVGAVTGVVAVKAVGAAKNEHVVFSLVDGAADAVLPTEDVEN